MKWLPWWIRKRLIVISCKILNKHGVGFLPAAQNQTAQMLFVNREDNKITVIQQETGAIH